MEEKDIVEAEFTEVSEETVGEVVDGALVVTEGELAVKEDAPEGKMSVDGFLSAISNAVKTEQITAQQGRELRTNMGIRQGYFTRNRNEDAAKAKAKRKVQKKSRKNNRRK